LKKALRALTFLNCNGDSTVTEVATAIGVPRTTSYRLLETLASEGYVEKQPHSHIYRLTSMVQNLSSGFGDSDLVVEVAKPWITQVGAEVRWPLALATPIGCDMMVRVITDHDTPLAIDRYFIGFRTPMLYAPSGLCYLAHCDEETRASVLDLIRRTGSTAEQPHHGGADLDFKLDQIRRQGFCHIRFAEYREGGLAAPLFAEGKVVGGIVMRYIKSTMKAAQLEEHYVPIVQKLASDIAASYAFRLLHAGQEAHDDAAAMVSAPGAAANRSRPAALPISAPGLPRGQYKGGLREAVR
jgi:IclR family mhp operon transcriptional activator